MTKTASFSHSVSLGDGHNTLSAARRPWSAVVAGLLWLGAGLSAGYWVLLALGRTPVTPVAATPMASPVADPALVARALGVLPVTAVAGVAQAPMAAPSRYVLLGVVAVAGNQGAALIGMDGQPPRPYRVGAVIDGGLVLQAVSRNTARLGPALQGPSTVELAVPEAPVTAP